MLTLPTTTEVLLLWEQISKIGWPMLFVIGLLRSWWVIGPHHDEVKARINALTDDLKASASMTERATDVAQESHELARKALDQMATLQHQIEVQQTTLHEIRLELARLRERQER